MGKYDVRERGFTLIAALMLLVLLSGVAVGLMYMANSETRIGGNELEDNLAYYGAESGMEQLTADLAALYQTSMSPTPAQITNLTNFPPTTVPHMNYTETITWTPDPLGNPVTSWNPISSGPNQGLVAEIVPLTLNVSATRVDNGGANVNITRNVEVALIPVFQFGVFSDSDIDYFAGPVFDFGGRIHTNGNLFLASGSNLFLEDKAAAYGEVIRDQLENGWPTATGYTGGVYLPNTAGGCNTDTPGTNCLLLANTDGSWSGGIPPTGGTNTGWVTTSTTTFKGFIVNKATGATKLTLPFVGKNVSAIEIIRKPIAGELSSGTLGSSRLYNKAAIRILLASAQVDLHPERGALGDGEDVDLGALAKAATPINVAGIGNTVLGLANTTVDGNWVKPVNCGSGTYTNYNPNCATVGATTTYPIVDGWLRVEYQDAVGNWKGITNEWLKLGFSRNAAPNEADAANTGAPSAILLLQQAADRNADGKSDNKVAYTTSTNYYPINFYDDREGEPRDVALLAGTQCHPMGIMSAVEIDVGNLRRYLKGALGGSGNLVNYTNQNGYVLYFSDRRGEVPDPNIVPVATAGMSGLEDVVNLASANGIPDGALEGSPATSPEDVDGNLLPDTWGGQNIGAGFGVNTSIAPFNPYTVAGVNCLTVGRANKVTGARHVLKLVNGTLGNLPTRLDNNKGGFTVASENPVYVQGDYNASVGGGFGDPHSAAAVIADSVTLLSNNWSDLNSLNNPNNLGGRVGNTSFYRMAVAGGKNKYFQNIDNAHRDFGTDGGMHNFLRYIESWGGTLSYQGSLVSLYYSQYATGTFKCCTMVYAPPTRDYAFDSLFLDPANLPPGTPMFQDVVNLSYRQDYTPH